MAITYYAKFFHCMSGFPCTDRGNGPYRQTYPEADNDGREWVRGQNPTPGTTYSYKVETGNCMLSTACLRHKGLPDNCEELGVLRYFRQTYIESLPDADELLTQYRDASIRLIPQIEASPKRDEIYSSVYSLIQECIPLIRAGENQQAFDKYRGFMAHLEASMPA